MLHNIYGRARSGKTEYLFKVCEELIRQKKHTFLIVPEQGAVITERQVIERLGNRSNEYIEVINFKRLCNRVFRETGGLTQSYVDSAHKLLIMHKAIEDVRDMLCEYAGASCVSDFVKKALDTISEFGMFGITPTILDKSAEKLSDGENIRLCGKLRDFAIIYARYTELMTEKFGYHDSNGDLERLCEVLDKSRFFRNKTVIIDSFYGFTVPELQIIDRIQRDAEDLYVTYLWEKDGGILFERGRKAYERICRYATDNMLDSEDIHLNFDKAYNGESLFALERNFASEISGNRLSAPIRNDNSITLLECDSPYEEAKMAAAAVNFLTSKCGAGYSDIAICTRSVENYSGILDAELKRNGIPFSFSVRYDLMTRPVVAYILAAFEFARSKSKQSVLRLIKTGLTTLTEHEADLTECYIRTWNIQGRMFTDGEWLMNPDGYASAQDMTPRARTMLETVERAREKLITPLTVFEEDIRSAQNANDISRAVVRLLESGRYSAKSLSGDQIVYHNLVMDALDCIADVIGSEKITPKMYTALLEMILCEYDTGHIPSTVDEVVVADAELFRSAGIKYMIVPGLNDGVFPRKPGNTGIFSDREKNILSDIGIELSGTGIDEVYDELFLAYKVLSAPSDKLWLLYSKKDSSGAEAMASEIVSMCMSAVQGLAVESAAAAAELRLCLCDSALIADAVSTSNPEYAKAVELYLESKGIQIKKSQSETQNYLSAKTAEEIFGDNITLSPSRLDKFNYCACSYFGQYTLGLRPEPIASLGAAESGNIIHRILELLMGELAEKKAKGEEITAEYALEREKNLLSDYISELIGGEKAQKQLTGRFKYLYGRLSGALDACVSLMANELSQSDFVPADFEMTIGTKDADVPFASIPILDGNGKSTGNLTINGKIDRTDIYQKDGKVYIKVVDYKTGHKKFNLADVALGMNLQMLLYLYSLTQNGGIRYGTDNIVPAGVLYTPIHRPSLSAELGEKVGENAASKFNTSGILIDDMDILRAMEKNLENKFIPVKLKKDGSFYANSSITSLETMGRLLSCAADVASKLAREMQSGKIMKNPYRCPSVNSCDFCDMAPFCRYENGEAGTRYNPTSYSDEVFEKSGEAGDVNGI